MIRFLPIFFLAVVVQLPSQAFAQIFPIAIPDGARLDGPWTPIPLWSKIDEGLVTPDGVIITTTVNPSSEFFEVEIDNPIGEYGLVDSMSLQIRARKTGSAAVTLFCLVFDPDEFLPLHSVILPLSTTMANYGAVPTVDLAYTQDAFENVYVECIGNKTGGGGGVQIEIDALQIGMTEFPPEPFEDTRKIIFILLLLGFLVLGFTFQAGIFFLGSIFLLVLLMLEYDSMLFYIFGAGLISFLIFLTGKLVRGS